MQPEPEQRDRLVNRLARIEGQIRAVQRLIREGEDCEKILQQLSASRKALDRSFYELVGCLVESSVDSAVQSGQKTEAADIHALLVKYA